MNQLYAEVGVKRKETAATMLLRVLMIFGIIVGVLLLFLGSFFTFIGVAIALVMLFLLPKLNVEYEYIFVDGEIDFDRITSKSKRKTMLSIDMEQIEIVAKIGSHALDSYNNGQYIVKDFSSRATNSKPHIIIANVEEKRYKIAFEPNEKFLSSMKQKSPRKISQI